MCIRDNPCPVRPAGGKGGAFPDGTLPLQPQRMLHRQDDGAQHHGCLLHLVEVGTEHGLSLIHIYRQGLSSLTAIFTSGPFVDQEMAKLSISEDETSDRYAVSYTHLDVYKRQS